MRKSQRHALARADGEPLGIAGLRECWQRSAQDPQPLLSFTLLTRNADAHPVLKRFHKCSTRPACPKRSAPSCCCAKPTSIRGSQCHRSTCHGFLQRLRRTNWWPDLRDRAHAEIQAQHLSQQIAPLALGKVVSRAQHADERQRSWAELPAGHTRRKRRPAGLAAPAVLGTRSPARVPRESRRPGDVRVRPRASPGRRTCRLHTRSSQ